MRMDKAARLWLVKQARKNYWRVAGWWDLDDLIQEGHLHWYRIIRKYPDIDDKRHIMRLFQVTYINHLNTLSQRRSRDYEVMADMAVSLTGCSDDFSLMIPNISRAPEPVKAVLQLVSTEQGLQKLREPYQRREDGTRETFNERLSRLTGFQADFRNLFQTCLHPDSMLGT